MIVRLLPLREFSLLKNVRGSHPDLRSLSTASAIRKGLRSTAKSRFQNAERSQLRGNVARERNWRADSIRPDKFSRDESQSLAPAHRRSVSESSLRSDRPIKRSPVKSPTITYTTPASEFLYGKSTVIAALKSDSRKAYKLYVCRPEGSNTSQDHSAILKLGLARGARLKEDDSPAFRSLMDKMSSGRPHNGYVLEASPLPKRPVQNLAEANPETGCFGLVPDHQSKEEEDLNGTGLQIKYDTSEKRYPMVLFLDGILDPGNFGGILRSAYFLGVDAVVISTHNTALGAVALKAAAGAGENIPLLSVRRTGNFINDSQKHGWKFYAAVAPQSSETLARRGVRQPEIAAWELRSPLMDHPCVVMLGSEGEGLKRDLARKADYLLSIEGQRGRTDAVDSLNVSVAAGILCGAFLRQSGDK